MKLRKSLVFVAFQSKGQNRVKHVEIRTKITENIFLGNHQNCLISKSPNFRQKSNFQLSDKPGDFCF